MSMGIGAGANLILEDGRIIKYEYGGYNLNDLEYKNEKQIYDGSITISRECFAKPEAHEKVKSMLEEGLIKVENCSHCWKVTDDGLHIDAMACQILFKLFRKYQEDGKIPERIGYDA